MIKKILFVGSIKKGTNSFYTYKVLSEKYNVDIIDIDKFFYPINLIYILLFYFNFFLPELWFNYKFKKNINKRYDLIFTLNGEFFGKKILLLLKKRGIRLIFLCLDNPYFNEDKLKWLIAKKSMHIYDKVIFQQPTRIKYAKKNKLNFSLISPIYNKDITRNIKLNFENRRYKRDVLIIGTWFPERGKLAKDLIKSGINIEIFGQRWEKDKNYKFIKKYIKHNKPILGHKYFKTIYDSKLTICQPNKENDDDITNKSIEIPAYGSLLLAKKTKSHDEIFKNYVNAVLFNNSKDLIKKIKKLIKKDSFINKISMNGYKKISLDKKFNFKTNLLNIINQLN